MSGAVFEMVKNDGEHTIKMVVHVLPGEFARIETDEGGMFVAVVKGGSETISEINAEPK